MDRVSAFLSQKTPRRALALAGFVGALYLFRHLAIVFVFFVSFQRALGFAARLMEAKTGISRKKSVLVIVGVLASLLGILVYLQVGKTIQTFAAMQETLPDRLAELRQNPLVEKLEDQFGGTEKILETCKHYAGDAFNAAKAVGYFVVHVLMAFVLALVYVLEEDELRAFYARVDPRSITGTLARWFGHAADATVVTVQLQLIVAACNTAMTLPVLLIIGVPHVGPLMLLIFVSALVPVIGNIVSGVVLSLMAYQAKGWLGVGLFIGLTFILHKIESYYLNPRLTSRHVKIPGFLLIVSLLAWEHLLGFTGLFLSFPILFVAGRIRGEFLEEDAGAAGSPIDLSDSPDQLPTSHHAPEPTGMELAPTTRRPSEREEVDADAGDESEDVAPETAPSLTETPIVPTRLGAPPSKP